MAANLDQTWAEIRNRLRQSFSDSTYQIWLSELEPVAVEQGTLYVRCPDATRDWLRRRYQSTLCSAASAADSSIGRVELIEWSIQTGSSEVRPAAPSRAKASLKPTYNFNRFVIGSANRFAHAAALTVAEMPGHTYNPLVIYGPRGSGKTHLLQAIANYIAIHGCGLTPRYVTAEAFTGNFLVALQHDEIAAFKQAHRLADVLLLDDVHFLEGKLKTSEEFFHTFDALLSSSTQIVLSCNCHPGELRSLDGGLKERLQAGLVVDLEPPDLRTRLVILRNLAAHSQAVIDDEVLVDIASRLPPNIRVLEGALIRVLAFASLTDAEITAALTDRVLASLYQGERQSTDGQPSRKTIGKIQQETAAALDLRPADICSSSRTRQVVYARQIAMYLARELTAASFPTIAQHFGGRDHTTVLQAHRRVTAQLLTDPATRSLITAITQAIGR